MAITLKLSNLTDSAAPLYYTYPLQNSPQPAYVQLNGDGTVTADYSGEIGNAMPASVWHGIDRRYSVDASVSGKALLAYLEGEGRALLDRIHAGHDEKWNGNNYVGTLDADAKVAEEQLIQGLETIPDAEVWSAYDWLFSGCCLFDHWQGRPLSEAVAELQNQVEPDVELDGNIEDALLRAAEIEFDEDGDDKLDAHHLAALVAAGRITQEQANARNESED
ncbi:hypothetical protein CEK28_08510 [Xenophilus sp. AP218F]|nr:hypothetical protein CEK28_08510 [Xenophilus sp. AP218F]